MKQETPIFNKEKSWSQVNDSFEEIPLRKSVARTELNKLALSTHADRNKFIESSYVRSLNKETFKDFLKENEVAMVMFYDPASKDCEWSKDHFVKAAENTIRDNHGYYAVDCTGENELCCMENVEQVPLFKLYTRGQTVNIIKGDRLFNADDMKAFVEKAPVAITTPSSKCSTCPH